MANLYLIANYTGEKIESFLWKVEEALRGGIVMVQLRAKTLDDDSFYYLGKKMLELCQKWNKPLIINDSVAIAHAVGAHGVHVGASDTSIAHIRNTLGKKALIGFSLSLGDNLHDADGANYIAATPVFATKTKLDVGMPYGLSGLSGLVQQAPCPVVAIGGISRTNIVTVAKTGCAAIAIVSAIMNAESPYDETRHLQMLMDKPYA